MIKFFLNSVYLNLIVSTSAALLSIGFVGLTDGANKWYYGALSFTAIFLSYNLQRIIKSKNQQQTPWLDWVNRNAIWLILLSAVGGVVSLIIFLYLYRADTHSFWIVFTSLLITLLYALPIKGFALRRAPYLKIHLISLVWALVLMVFPAINEGMGSKTILFAGMHYFYVLAVSIPFDIRDLRYDEERMRTIPQVIGIQKAKLLSVLLLIAFTIVSLVLFPILLSNVLFYLSIIVQVILVIGMNESRGDLYCAGLIDGSIALLGLSYLFQVNVI